MEFDYIFQVEVGPEYYSDQTDETFCDIENVNYSYSISQNEILNGLIEYLNIRNKPIKSQIEMIIKSLDIDIDESEILNSVDNYNNIYEIMNNLLNNIEDYINEEIEDFLKDYYESDAYNEFLKN